FSSSKYHRKNQNHISAFRLPAKTKTHRIVTVRGLGTDSDPNTPQEDDKEVNSLGVRAALSMLSFYKSKSLSLFILLIFEFLVNSIKSLKWVLVKTGEISPLMPRSCRYVPTCSEYSMQAYKKYGVVKGSVLTAWRLCRCNPLGNSVALFSFLKFIFGTLLSVVYVDTNPNKRSLKSLPSFVDLDNLVQATFVLTCEDIKELRDNILSVLDKVNGNEVKKFDKLHLSTFVLTGAYVYSCMVKAKGAENNRDVLFGFTADYRKCLDLPIPMNYFGNCVGTRAMVAKTRDFMEETGVLFVAEKLSDMIKELEDGLTLEGFEEKLVKLMPMMKSVAQGAQGLGVIGSNRFDAYKSDFG
ncbi:hypothetical protein CUMW_108110, partial [Citrus unshiu]